MLQSKTNKTKFAGCEPPHNNLWLRGPSLTFLFVEIWRWAMKVVNSHCLLTKSAWLMIQSRFLIFLACEIRLWPWFILVEIRIMCFFPGEIMFNSTGLLMVKSPDVPGPGAGRHQQLARLQWQSFRPREAWDHAAVVGDGHFRFDLCTFRNLELV